MPKAYSTIGTILQAGSTVATLSKICKIKSYPDLGGAPETVESTDLEDTFQTFVEGVQSMDALEFTANYTDTDYAAIKASAGDELYYQLEMGVSGEVGRFRWKGTHSVRVTGGDVNAVREMVVTVVPSTAITALSAPSPTPSVTLSSSAVSVEGTGSTSVTATVVPSGSDVTWASANTAVATVSNTGVITGVSVGATTISATIKVDGTDYSGYCVVSVTEEE